MKNHLKYKRLRFLFDVTSGATPKSGEPAYWDGEIQWVTPEDLGRLNGKYIAHTKRRITAEGYHSCGVKSVPPGSIVFSKRAPIGQTAILKYEATCNQGCFLVSPLHGVDEVFYYYCLVSQRPMIEILGRGSTFMELSADDFKSVSLPFPDQATQRRIADYLDRETAQIDELVAAKESMLRLLEEKRSALISRAVTRGLDPKAPTKPSGLDWLGEIPEHWEVHRCAALFFEKDERNEPDLPLLNVSLNTGVTLRVFSDDKIESVASDLATMKVAKEGDLVFNKMRFWQGAAGIAPADGLVSPDYTVATVSPKLSTEYVESLFRIRRFNGEVRRYSYGMVDDRLRLYWDGFKNIQIPVPPLEEQHSIVTHLQAHQQRSAELESTLRNSIALLKERRSALITAAVTGQISMEEMSA